MDGEEDSNKGGSSPSSPRDSTEAPFPSNSPNSSPTSSQTSSNTSTPRQTPEIPISTSSESEKRTTGSRRESEQGAVLYDLSLHLPEWLPDAYAALRARPGAYAPLATAHMLSAASGIRQESESLAKWAARAAAFEPESLAELLETALANLGNAAWNTTAIRQPAPPIPPPLAALRAAESQWKLAVPPLSTPPPQQLSSTLASTLSLSTVSLPPPLAVATDDSVELRFAAHRTPVSYAGAAASAAVASAAIPLTLPHVPPRMHGSSASAVTSRLKRIAATARSQRLMAWSPTGSLLAVSTPEILYVFHANPRDGFTGALARIDIATTFGAASVSWGFGGLSWRTAFLASHPHMQEELVVATLSGRLYRLRFAAKGKADQALAYAPHIHWPPPDHPPVGSAPAGLQQNPTDPLPPVWWFPHGMHKPITGIAVYQTPEPDSPYQAGLLAVAGGSSLSFWAFLDASPWFVHCSTRDVGENTITSLSWAPPQPGKEPVLATADIHGAIALWTGRTGAAAASWTTDGLFPNVPPKSQVPDPPPGVSHAAISSITWWSSTVMAVSRLNGQFGLFSTSTGAPLLLGAGGASGGAGTELFAPRTAATSRVGGRLFLLEQTSETSPPPGVVREADIDAGLENRTWLEAASDWVWDTDSSAYVLGAPSEGAPPRAYRLISLAETTPSSLLTSKVAQQDYEAALAIAEEFGLSPDPIYQAQWADAPVSPESIQAHLVPIRDRAWVLKELASRVPESWAGAQALIDHGLALTSADAVLAAADAPATPPRRAFVSTDTNKSSSGVPLPRVSELNETQKRLVTARFIYLRHQERLGAAHILFPALDRRPDSRSATPVVDSQTAANGDEELEVEFDAGKWSVWRDADVVETAVRLARACHIPGLDALIRVSGKQLASWRLHVLWALPVSFQVSEYSHLLPAVSSDPDQEPKELPWTSSEPDRELDWAESADGYASAFGFPAAGPGSAALTGDLSGVPDYGAPASSSELTHWYQSRAEYMDESGGAVSNALDLVDIGSGLGVTGLGVLRSALYNINLLIYSAGVESDVTLKDWAGLSVSQQLALFAGSAVEPDEVAAAVIEHGLPFLQRTAAAGAHAASTSALSEYLVSLAESNRAGAASSVLMKAAEVNVFGSEADTISVGLKVAYAVGASAEDLEAASNIVSALPERDARRAAVDPGFAQLHDALDALVDHIRLSTRLSAQYGLSCSLSLWETAAKLEGKAGYYEPYLALLPSNASDELDNTLLLPGLARTVAAGTGEPSAAQVVSVMIQTARAALSSPPRPDGELLAMMDDLVMISQVVRMSEPGTSHPLPFAIWLGAVAEDGRVSAVSSGLHPSVPLRASLSDHDVSALLLSAAHATIWGSTGPGDSGLGLARDLLDLTLDGTPVAIAVDSTRDLLDGFAILASISSSLALIPAEVKDPSHRLRVLSEAFERDSALLSAVDDVLQVAYLWGLKSVKDASVLRVSAARTAVKSGASRLGAVALAPLVAARSGAAAGVAASLSDAHAHGLPVTQRADFAGYAALFSKSSEGLSSAVNLWKESYGAPVELDESEGDLVGALCRAETTPDAVAQCVRHAVYIANGIAASGSAVMMSTLRADLQSPSVKAWMTPEEHDAMLGDACAAIAGEVLLSGAVAPSSVEAWHVLCSALGDQLGAFEPDEGVCQRFKTAAEVTGRVRRMPVPPGHRPNMWVLLMALGIAPAVSDRIADDDEQVTSVPPAAEVEAAVLKEFEKGVSVGNVGSLAKTLCSVPLTPRGSVRASDSGLWAATASSALEKDGEGALTDVLTTIAPKMLAKDLYMLVSGAVPTFGRVSAVNLVTGVSTLLQSRLQSPLARETPSDVQTSLELVNQALGDATQQPVSTTPEKKKKTAPATAQSAVTEAVSQLLGSPEPSLKAGGAAVVAAAAGLMSNFVRNTLPSPRKHSVEPVEPVEPEPKAADSDVRDSSVFDFDSDDNDDLEEEEKKMEEKKDEVEVEPEVKDPKEEGLDEEGKETKNEEDVKPDEKELRAGDEVEQDVKVEEIQDAKEGTDEEDKEVKADEDVRPEDEEDVKAEDSVREEEEEGVKAVADQAPEAVRVETKPQAALESDEKTEGQAYSSEATIGSRERDDATEPVVKQALPTVPDDKDQLHVVKPEPSGTQAEPSAEAKSLVSESQAPQSTSPIAGESLKVDVPPTAVESSAPSTPVKTAPLVSPASPSPSKSTNPEFAATATLLKRVWNRALAPGDLLNVSARDALVVSLLGASVDVTPQIAAAQLRALGRLLCVWTDSAQKGSPTNDRTQYSMLWSRLLIALVKDRGALKAAAGWRKGAARAVLTDQDEQALYEAVAAREPPVSPGVQIVFGLLGRPKGQLWTDTISLLRDPAGPWAAAKPDAELAAVLVSSGACAELLGTRWALIATAHLNRLPAFPPSAAAPPTPQQAVAWRADCSVGAAVVAFSRAGLWSEAARVACSALKMPEGAGPVPWTSAGDQLEVLKVYMERWGMLPAQLAADGGPAGARKRLEGVPCGTSWAEIRASLVKAKTALVVAYEGGLGSI